MMTISKSEAARELLARRVARRSLHAYIKYIKPDYIDSWFAEKVCQAIENFIEMVFAGKRPILILQAPPQHGKSEIVSRKLPSYMMGKWPGLRVAAASYSSTLADEMSSDVRQNLVNPLHLNLFPVTVANVKYKINRNGQFANANGSGSYIGDGIGGGFTGRPADIFIIDDPIKNASEALSETIKKSHWDWYQSTCITRMSKNSGQIIMATSWADDDLAGKIAAEYKGSPRLIELRFPAINEPGEAGYNSELPRGPLVPELHPIEQLHEIKGTLSAYWWAAMFQQSPEPAGGNIFKKIGIRFYRKHELPKKFDKTINSWDCTFKDTDGSDYVVGQAWGKAGPNSYLLDQMRDRMSFTDTLANVVRLRNAWPATVAVLIEDKANGPAVLDVLKVAVPGLIPIEPDGSKQARAHAVTSYWEAGNVWLPHPDECPWIKDYINEITRFPAAANDDQVDATTQALRNLYPVDVGLGDMSKALAKAMGR